MPARASLSATAYLLAWALILVNSFAGLTRAGDITEVALLLDFPRKRRFTLLLAIVAMQGFVVVSR